MPHVHVWAVERGLVADADVATAGRHADHEALRGVVVEPLCGHNQAKGLKQATESLLVAVFLPC